MLINHKIARHHTTIMQSISSMICLLIGKPNSGDGFRVPYADLSSAEIDALSDEIVAVATATTTTTTTTTTVQP